VKLFDVGETRFPLHGEAGMMELNDLAQLRPGGLLQSAPDIDEQALGEQDIRDQPKTRADDPVS
jgi:hypothetical protein